MARPTTIDDETILAAARDLFRERGLQVTTADVAKRAGVSEGSIFRRFPSKRDLFMTAMTDSAHDWIGRIGDFPDDAPLRDNLNKVADEAIDHFLRVLPVFYRMVGSGLIEPHELGCAFDEPPPLEAVRRLTAYLESERERGRIEVESAEVVARVLLGALHTFAFFEIMGLNALQPMSRDKFVEGLVEQTLTGIEACR